MFDLLYQRYLSASKATKFYELLRNLRNGNSRCEIPFCTVLEIDEEDEPDSDSDCDSEFGHETTLKVNPLIL